VSRGGAKEYLLERVSQIDPAVKPREDRFHRGAGPGGISGTEDQYQVLVDDLADLFAGNTRIDSLFFEAEQPGTTSQVGATFDPAISFARSQWTIEDQSPVEYARLSRSIEVDQPTGFQLDPDVGSFRIIRLEVPGSIG
jgi:hypothetical protein